MKTRRISSETNIRKISKTAGGSSYSITLPIDIVRRRRCLSALGGERETEGGIGN